MNDHKIKKKIIKAAILSNRKVAADMYTMDIGSKWLGEKSAPGQFVNVKVFDGITDPLLRVPLGIYSIRENGISLLYKVVGPGTDLLRQRKEGEIIDVIGPLGNGFDISKLKRGATAVSVGGGYGIVPVFALNERLSGKGVDMEFFAGARTGEHIVGEKHMRDLGVNVHITTDDGTCGVKGCVTDLLLKFLKKNAGEKNDITIFACGPRPMLIAVSKLAEEYGIPAQVTNDEYMACGIGACRGCAVKTTNGIRLSCSDGPVFDSKVVIWE
jgi:dihydroorotate dehydrogenase electron transfer subunit